MSSTRLTHLIVAGLVLGIVAGYVSNTSFSASSAGFAEITSLLPTAFLRLIRMIIAPLVFSTLVVGIARMGDIVTVGRWRQGAGLVHLRFRHLAHARHAAGRLAGTG